MLYLRLKLLKFAFRIKAFNKLVINAHIKFQQIIRCYHISHNIDVLKQMLYGKFSIYHFVYRLNLKMQRFVILGQFTPL